MAPSPALPIRMREQQCRANRAATETVDVTARTFVGSGLSVRAELHRTLRVCERRSLGSGWKVATAGISANGLR